MQSYLHRFSFHVTVELASYHNLYLSEWGAYDCIFATPFHTLSVLQILLGLLFSDIMIRIIDVNKSWILFSSWTGIILLRYQVSTRDGDLYFIAFPILCWDSEASSLHGICPHSLSSYWSALCRNGRRRLIHPMLMDLVILCHPT